eukprot:Skav231908  [mRNA]  locus=scaffold344:4793:6245:+ [translate_table: standard]
MVRRSEEQEQQMTICYGTAGAKDWKEIEFIMIDLRDAFCHFAIHQSEWRHAVTPDETEAGALLWVAMLFGYKAAPYLMSRLSAAIGRLLQSMVLPSEQQAQIYMDDIILAIRGPATHRAKLTAMVLHTVEIFGVQVAHNKGERGVRVQWIGASFEIKDNRDLMISLQPKMIQEIKEEVGTWLGRGMIPIKTLRKITGKLSWVAGVLPRLRWVINMFYATLAAAEKEEQEGVAKDRRAKRHDTREKKGLVAAKRLKLGIQWVTALFEKPEQMLIRVEPLVERPVFRGIITDASPRGMGGLLVRLREGSDRLEVLEAFETVVSREETALLKVEYGEASSQAVMETLAILRALHKWGTELQGMSVLIRSDSATALGVVVQHLRGKDNTETDWLSRPHDRGEKPETLKGVKIFRLASSDKTSGLFELPPPGAAASEGAWSASDCTTACAASQEGGF